MPTLYLHIGTPKTATTAIQEFCLLNGEALEKRGFCYPYFSYQYAHVSRRRNGHFLIGSIYSEDGCRDIAAEAAVWREGLDEVAKLLKTHEGVILSDETIWNTAIRKRGLWKRLKKEADAGGYQIKVIVYLRQQASYLSSQWNQLIKVGYNEEVSRWSWDEFIASRKWKERYALDYYEHLERISAVFGRESVMVRVFEKEQWAGQSIYSDFLNALGIAAEGDFVISDLSQNVSLTGNTHEIKRILNDLPGHDESTGIFVRGVMRVCSEKSDKSHAYSMFSREESEKFMADFEESNRRVAEVYLNRSDGMLFVRDYTAADKYRPDNPYMYKDLIRCFGEMALEQQKMILELKEESLKQQKEVSELSRKMDKIHIVYDHPVRSVGKWLKNRGKQGRSTAG